MFIKQCKEKECCEYLDKPKHEFKKSYREITGAIHLHTTYSDGGITIKELINAAKTVGLNFIIVTDHMTLRGLDEGYEGLTDNLCVLVGYEHHDPHKNHYLALGVDQVLTLHLNHRVI